MNVSWHRTRVERRIERVRHVHRMSWPRLLLSVALQILVIGALVLLLVRVAG